MVEEQSMYPLKSIFFLIMVIVLLAVIGLAVWLFFNLTVEVESKELDRATVELSHAISKSQLTSDLAIFKKEELDKYHNTEIEPYVRHCKYGYKAAIETDKGKWEFGYSPDEWVESSIGGPSRFSVAVLNDGIVEPAKLEVKAYNTWTTRIACLLEGAYLSWDVVSTEFNCPDDLGMKYHLCGFDIRREDGNPDSDFVCIYDWKEQKDRDCRYLPDVPIIEQGIFYGGYLNGDVRELKAIPVRRSAAQSLIDEPCSEAEKHKAGKGEDAVFILCFEQVESDKRSGEISRVETADRAANSCAVNFAVKNTGSFKWEKVDRVKVVLECGIILDIPQGTEYIEELLSDDERSFYFQNPTLCPKPLNAGEDYKINLYADCDFQNFEFGQAACGPHAELLDSKTFRCNPAD